MKKKVNQSSHKTGRKKLSLTSKLTLSLLILLGISLFYFVVLVSTKPKSIPYVTAKVEQVLKDNFGDDVKVEKTFFSFTRYATLKFVGVNISLFYETFDKQTVQKQVLILPKIETEFSIFNLLTFKFQPKKIRIIDPNITINLASIIKNEEQTQGQSQTDFGELSAITQFLHQMRKGDIVIERFEIQNAILNIKDDNFTNKIFIKLAKIKADARDRDLTFDSQSVVTLNNDKQEVAINSECVFFKDSKLQCDANVKNLIPSALAQFHSKLSDLDKIETKLDGDFKFKVIHKKLKNFEFNLRANNGSFLIPEFFSRKFEIQNFHLRGDYDHEIAFLNLSEIEGDIVSDLNKANGYGNPHLSMSLMVSNLKEQNKKMDFYIRMQNVLQQELENFWPITLNQNNIRSWVNQHLSDGLIKNAFAKFSLILGQNNILQDINSEVVFSDMNLVYDQYFPALKNINGLARFSKNNMEIKINSGEVLQSKVFDATIAIDDFNSASLILKINGNLEGNSADGLKHVNYNSQFASQIEKYLNGKALSKFNITLPIDNNLNFENTEIEVYSKIDELKNDYVNGNVVVNSKKAMHSNVFVNEIDLTNAQINLDDFDLTKNNNVDSKLSFNLVISDNDIILFRNIDFYKNEEIANNDSKKTATQIAKTTKLSSLKGDFALDYKDSKLLALKLTNKNFGNNNFVLDFNLGNNQQNPQLIIKGEKLYAQGLLKSKIFSNSQSKKTKEPIFENIKIAINLNRVELLRKKFLKNFNFFLNCQKGLCPELSASANYGKLQVINIQATKKPKENYAIIDGNITDIGYLAEGLGISNIISDGNARINLKQNVVDKKIFIEGKVEIDDDITIFENETVKKFAKDNLYSQIKDSIFSSDKTTFDSVKVDFSYSEESNILKLKSLIANNLKIGITAKGEINFNDDSMTIRGMIIPGYIVNSLFGIGKIPVIGSVLSGILTGGEGGGLFGLRYEYVKNSKEKEGKFTTNKVSAFVPSTIQNLFSD
jgi:hypothetical protein